MTLDLVKSQLLSEWGPEITLAREQVEWLVRVAIEAEAAQGAAAPPDEWQAVERRVIEAIGAEFSVNEYPCHECDNAPNLRAILTARLARLSGAPTDPPRAAQGAAAPPDTRERIAGAFRRIITRHSRADRAEWYAVAGDGMDADEVMASMFLSALGAPTDSTEERG